jgi:hypothetical protein
LAAEIVMRERQSLTEAKERETNIEPEDQAKKDKRYR